MHMTVLFASPRGRDSNTLSLLEPLLAEWTAAGHTAQTFSLYDLEIRACRACRGCQQDWTSPACVLQDDMQPIFEDVLRCDILLLAAPIYSWFCPAPMKAALDRLVYAMDKFYGPRGKGPALMQGKALALVTTCGYRPEKGTDLFAEGLRRWCHHTGLRWLGTLAERHMGYDRPFMDEEKAAHAQAFAQELLCNCCKA